MKYGELLVKKKRGRGRSWPVQVKIYWCKELNVPMLGEECPGGGRAQRIFITEPADARPAFKHDLEILERAYRRETGGLEGYNELRGKGVVLFNKVPFMDLMYEVIIQGVVVGRLYWDPAESGWRLRFSLPGLKRIWDKAPLAKYRLKWGIKELARRRMFPNTNNYEPGTQIVFVDGDNNPVGIGYVLSMGDKIKLHSAYWKDRPASLGDKDTSWDDVIEANEYYLYYYTSRAVKFIHVMNEKVRKDVIVSFSGGKDSLVALHLTLRTGLRPYLLFNDTGIEMPETRETVRSIAEKYGLELLTADAGDAFWRAVERVGPPGKDYRWCCKVTKLAPLARLLESRFPEGALNIVGQRAYESYDRARSPRVWRNRWLPRILNISPIQEWPQLLIWLYIWKEKLEYNPLYERGFDRIGCFMCPAAFNAEYEFVKETRPELWKKWENVLERWADKIGYTGKLKEAYVKKGLWRWLTPAAQKQRLAYRLRVELLDWRETYRRWLDPSLLRVEWDDKETVAEFNHGFDPESLGDQYSVLGAFSVREKEENRIVLDSKPGVKIVMEENKVRVIGVRGVFARELLLDTVKLAFRWTHCAGCRACETSCPTGAIKVVEENGRFIPRVDNGSCIHCKLCLDNCPLADVTAERIYSALYLDDPIAWRRSSKRTHESVIRRYLALKGYRIEDTSGGTVLDEDTLIAPAALYEESNNS